MDPGLAVLLGEFAKAGLAAYIISLRLQGKSEEEIRIEFERALDEAMTKNPKDIKDV